METKKLYFYEIGDDGKNFFKSPEDFIKFLTDNTSEDETVEVGCEELTDSEWAKLTEHGDDHGPYKESEAAQQ